MASVYRRNLKRGPVWYARLRLQEGHWISYNTRIPVDIADSENKARRAAKKLQHEIDIGRESELFGTQKKEQAELRFSDAAQKYWQDRRRIWARNTEILNRQSAQLFQELVGDVEMSRFCRDDLILFRDSLIERGAKNSGGARFKDFSPSSINIHLRNIRALLHWCSENDVVEFKRIPQISLLRIPSAKTRDHFRPMEVEKLIEAARSISSPDYNIALFISLLLLTGMRRGEALQLKWGDFDFTRKMIILRAENTKTGQSRQVPLVREIEILVSNIECDAGEKLFPNLRPATMSRIFPKLCRRAGVRKLKLHNCRDTFAANAVIAGLPMPILQRIMGHADIRTTAKYYLDWDPIELKLAADIMNGKNLATAVLRGLNLLFGKPDDCSDTCM